jgi:hypothetical protein
MRKPFRVRLLFGTLKIATYLQLNSAEHDGLVPSRKFGRFYLIWKGARAPLSRNDLAP